MTSTRMRIARATTADIESAMTLANALESLALGHFDDHEDGPAFDVDDAQSCQRAIRRLLDLHDRGSLLRVIWGMATIVDPANAVIDPDADALQLHPTLVRKAVQASEEGASA